MPMQRNTEYQVHGEWILANGFTVCRTNEGEPVLCLGILPLERGTCITRAKRTGEWYAEILQITDICMDRAPAMDEHFSACGPLQICTEDFEHDFKYKSLLALYESHSIAHPSFDLYTNHIRYHYRTKMEWSFYADGDELYLALHGRGGGAHRHIAHPCALALPQLNVVAGKVLDWLRVHSVPRRILKSLIVRTNSSGQSIFGLFVTDPEFTLPRFSLTQDILGYGVFFSNPKSPASVNTQTLYTEGTLALLEQIDGRVFEYSLFSFMQNNIPVFEEALRDMARYIPSDLPSVDYYCGVGSIGLSLEKSAHIFVDSEPTAIDALKRNAELNSITCAAYARRSEELLEYITPQSTLIVDPPRAGLHGAVIARVLSVLPHRIVYLSCNPETQCRDIVALQARYEIAFARGYNFFPCTPHIENLVVLSLRG